MNICTGFKNIFLWVLVGFFLSTPVYAEDITITAEVNSKGVDMQTVVELRITINGEQSIPPLKFPEIDGFESQYVGTSRGVTIVNGRYSSSISFIYNLFPQRPGILIIPRLTVNINGQSLKTNEIIIEVVNDATSDSRDAGLQTDLSDKVFIRVETPKTNVYHNEKVSVKVILFVGGVEIRDIQYPKIFGEGIRVGEQEQAKQYQQVIEGVRYDVVEFNVSIYPARIGGIDLNVELDSNILYKTMNSRSRSRIDSVFNDAFFGELLGRHEKRPLTVKALPKTLNVLALPSFTERGKQFSGGVGQFDFQVEVGPEFVRVGDPLTLRMMITGDGDLSVVKFPHLNNANDYKMYDPSIKAVDGKKLLEQVVIPLSKEVKSIPAFHFIYFDPDLEAYQTITRGPLPVNVQPASEGEVLQIVGATDVVFQQPEVSLAVGSDIVFIKELSGRMKPVGIVFYRSPMYWLAVVILLFFWSSAILYYNQAHRMANDQVYAKRLKAPKKAKIDIHHAEKLLQQPSAEKFYTQVFRTLSGYIHYKLNISQGEISKTVLCADVRIQNLKTDISHLLTQLFDECDAARYASQNINQKQKERSLSHLRQVIDVMERGIK